MSTFFIKTVMPVLIAMLLTGCGTLLGSKFYDIDVHPRIYNDTHEYLSEHTATVMLSENIDGSFNFITDGGSVYLLVAGTGHITKDNINERLRPYIDFLKWSRLKGNESLEKRTYYNQLPGMKQRYIEFRYFPDGTPAFVDTNDGQTGYEKALFNHLAKYYTPEQVYRLVSIAFYEVKQQKNAAPGKSG
jgi:hypothetical protein